MAPSPETCACYGSRKLSKIGEDVTETWLFCGSDRGGIRAAAMYTLIGTAKLNDVDPQAWLADVLGRIAGTPQSWLHELLPWNWARQQKLDQAA